MGYWGSNYEAIDFLNGLGIVIVGALIMLVTRWTLVREEGSSLAVRFLPPFLVVLGGLILFEPSIKGLLNLSTWTNYMLTTFVELFSQLFHWSLIVLALRDVDIYPYRTQGIAYAIYGASSLAFLFLAELGNAVITLLIFLTYFSSVAMMICIVSNYHREPSSNTRTIRMHPALEHNVNNFDGVAQQFGLSPREEQVFALLMQGRNRTYIQNELFLAEGTVKTHTSRIYRKIGVTNRQDMITAVQQLLDKDAI